jgi:CO/xanthine dehydrogenase Mo-binding subunit
LYTNHPYATAFRGFGHSELTFVVERAVDILAEKLCMDPLKLRFINSLEPGDTSPTNVTLTPSNIGNLKECIKGLSKLMDWEKDRKVVLDNGKVLQKAVSCFWKTSNTPTDAGAGAVVTFNRDGSINIICAAVEIGQGTRTGLALIAAEKFKMDPDMVHIKMQTDTVSSPEHWKTAASLTTIMVGNAVISACEDAIKQLKEIAAVPLRANSEDLCVAEGRVYIKSDPLIGIDIKDVAFGYEYPNGNTIGHYVTGRGSYILKGLTHMDPETGEGKTGVEWAVGAQGVEVEYDLRNYTYKILKAYIVIDAGKVINKKTARGQMTGGMAMGLSFASREAFLFNKKGIVLNPVLRTYKVLRYKENPQYFVDFVETPFLDGPYGARGLGEYGVIGMPAALANCLSQASGVQLKRLPLIPELIWETKRSIENAVF